MAIENPAEATIEIDEDIFEALNILNNRTTYGVAIVAERVFVTWFETPAGDEFNFLTDQKYIELTPEQAQDYHDLSNHQHDQLQALFEGFVLNQEAANAPVDSSNDLEQPEGNSHDREGSEPTDG